MSSSLIRPVRYSTSPISIAVGSLATKSAAVMLAVRHTCLTNLVRGGTDLVLVAEIAGYKRLETTRRYSLPTLADKTQALQKLVLVGKS